MFYVCVVVWLCGFIVVCFQCFMVLRFYGFFVSKIDQISISCFLEDIGLISKIFKILLDGSSSFFGARLFESCQRFGFPKFRYL